MGSPVPETSSMHPSWHPSSVTPRGPSTGWPQETALILPCLQNHRTDSPEEVGLCSKHHILCKTHSHPGREEMDKRLGFGGSGLTPQEPLHRQQPVHFTRDLPHVGARQKQSPRWCPWGRGREGGSEPRSRQSRLDTCFGLTLQWTPPNPPHPAVGHQASPPPCCSVVCPPRPRWGWQL